LGGPILTPKGDLRLLLSVVGGDPATSAACGQAEETKKDKHFVSNWLFVQTTHVVRSKSNFACTLLSGDSCR